MISQRARRIFVRAMLALAPPLCVATAARAQTASGAPPDILGEWRGASLCTNRQLAPACKDETVRYRFASSATAARVVHLDADKLVNGQYEEMGAMELQFDTATRQWQYDFDVATCACRWSFAVRDSMLTGSLASRVTGANVRQVSATRFTPLARQR